MALKTGKEEIKLKADTSAVPYKPARSTFGIALEAFKPTIDRLQTEAAMTHQAEWYNSFMKDVSSKYLEFENLYPNQPEKLKEVSEIYNQSLIDNAIPEYKYTAVSILANKSANAVSKASNLLLSQKNANLVMGSNFRINETSAEISKMLENTVNSPLYEQGQTLAKINHDAAINGFAMLNDNFRQDFDTLVNIDRPIINETTHRKNITDSVFLLEVDRVMSVIRSLPDEKAQNEYFQAYAAGIDSFAIDSGEFAAKGINENDFIYSEYKRLYDDVNEREKLVNTIKQRYKVYNDSKLAELTTVKNKDISIAPHLEVGGDLHPHNFAYGMNSNATDFVDNHPEFQFATGDKRSQILGIIQDNIDIQSEISKVIQTIGSDSPYVFRSGGDKEKETLFEKAMLSRYGINNTKDLVDPANRGNLSSALFTLKKQPIELPEFISNYLEQEIHTTAKEPATLAEFKNKVDLYKFVTSEDYFSTFSLNNNIAWAADHLDLTLPDSAIAQKIDDYNKADRTIIKDSFSKQLGENNWSIIKSDIDSVLGMWGKDAAIDAWWVNSLFEGKENEFSFLMKPTFFGKKTILPKSVRTMMTEDTYAALNMHILDELTFTADNPNIDINSGQYKKSRRNAILRAMMKMKSQGYGFTNYAGIGDPKFVKNAFENNYPVPKNILMDEVHALVNSKVGKMSELEYKQTWGAIEGTVWGTDAGNIFTGKTRNVHTNVMKKIADNNGRGIIIRDTGAITADGKPQYKVGIQADEFTFIPITDLDESFTPMNYDFLGNKNIKDNPATHAQLMDNIAFEMYEAFINKYDIEPSNFVKRALRGTMEMGASLGNWRYHPDWPGFDDVPADVRPFAFVLKMLGKDYNLKEIKTTMAKEIDKRNKLISFDDKIQNNMDLSDTEKRLEMVNPPWETHNQKHLLQGTYKTFAKENYTKTELAGIGKNNYMGVHWVNKGLTGELWDGQMNIKVPGNTLAVFNRPSDSFRAAVKIMINHSTLSNNDVKKNYGYTPSVNQIINMYAEDTKPYVDAAKKHNFNLQEKINFFDPNQMLNLMEFMMSVEVGSKLMNEYYPVQNREMLRMFMLEGYNNAISSYKGDLGKIKVD